MGWYCIPIPPRPSRGLAPYSRLTSPLSASRYTRLASPLSGTMQAALDAKDSPLGVLWVVTVPGATAATYATAYPGEGAHLPAPTSTCPHLHLRQAPAPHPQAPAPQPQAYAHMHDKHLPAPKSIIALDRTHKHTALQCLGCGQLTVEGWVSRKGGGGGGLSPCETGKGEGCRSVRLGSLAHRRHQHCSAPLPACSARRDRGGHRQQRCRRPGGGALVSLGGAEAGGAGRWSVLLLLLCGARPAAAPSSCVHDSLPVRSFQGLEGWLPACWCTPDPGCRCTLDPVCVLCTVCVLAARVLSRLPMCFLSSCSLPKYFEVVVPLTAVGELWAGSLRPLCVVTWINLQPLAQSGGTCSPRRSPLWVILQSPAQSPT